MTKKRPSLITQVSDFLWALFLNGLFTILPLTLTIAIFNVSFKLLTSWLEPISRFTPLFLRQFPHAEIIIVIGVIFLIGTILKIFVLRSLINAIDKLFFKVPIIRTVYSGVKQLVHAFSLQDKISFKEIVMVEFPRKNIYSLGFLTSELPAELSPEINKRFFNVFVPTTPNPTSGYFIIVEESEFKAVDLTRQEAMALIISGGIIHPTRFSKEIRA